MSGKSVLQQAQHDPDQLSLFSDVEMEAMKPKRQPGGRRDARPGPFPQRQPKAPQSAQQKKSSAPAPHPMHQEGYQYRLFVDPEEHLAEMAAGGGSSDDETGGTAHGLAAMRARKLAEAKTPKYDTQGGISRYPRGHPEAGFPVHGAGLYESIRKEQVREPIMVIEDPSDFGRKGPIQYEGNHRAESAAAVQQELRAAGNPNWQRWLQPDYYKTGMEAVTAARALHQEKERNATSGPGVTTPFFRPPPLPFAGKTPTPQRKRRPGGGFGTGTWNSKAY